MNERIKQLALRAGLSEGVFTRHDGVPCNLTGYSMLPEQMEKFAELIVQDCMDVVDGYTKGRTFDTHYDAVEQIEALFGIKHNEL